MTLITISIPKDINAQCTIIPSDMETSVKTTTQRFFNNNLPDIRQQFDELWIKYDIEETYDNAVKNAIESVKNEYGVLKRFIAPFSKSKSREYCDRIISRIQKDPQFKSAITSLQEEMSRKITEELTNSANLAATRTLNCILHYLKNEVGDALAVAFLNTTLIRTKKNISVTLDSMSLDNSLLRQYLQIFTPAILTGVVAIGLKNRLPSLAAKTTAEIGEETIIRETETAVGEEAAEKVAQRTGTRLLARIITPQIIKGVNVVLTVLGFGLISYEIWKAPQKLDNIIYNELTSPRIIQAIKDTTLVTWTSFADEASPQITDMLSDTILGIWYSFQTDYKDLMNISREYPEIQQTLDSIPYDKLPIVASLASKLTKEKFLQALNNGDLKNLLNLPDKYQKPALLIAQNINDVALAVEWIRRSGTLIDKVLESKLYMYVNPHNVSIPFIRIASALPESSLIRLSNLDPTLLNTLVEVVPPNYIPGLIDSLNIDNLRNLLTVLPKLDSGSRSLILDMLSKDASKWPKLEPLLNDLPDNPPEKRKELILMTLSSNPIIRMRKAIQNPVSAIKVAPHDKLIGISYIFAVLFLIFFILITILILKTPVHLIGKLRR